MGKKGQITVFIIVAVVLVIAVGGYFAVRNITSDKGATNPSAQNEPLLKEQQSIKNGVDSCLKILAIDGLEAMRSQSGYIEVPDTDTIIVKDRFDGAYVSSDGIKHVVYSPASPGNKMPIWVTKDDVMVPSIEKMQTELETFIDSNMLKCLDDFKQYKNQGLKIEYIAPKSKVTFDNIVIIDLNFPISVTSESINFKMDSFKQTIPVNMRKIYDLASNIAFGEYDGAFLEYFTTDLISKYGYMGGDKGADDLPPFRYTDVSTDCNKVTWSLDEVEGKLKKTFFNNYKYVQLANTDYSVPQGAYASVLETYIYAPFPGKFQGTNVDFFYDPEFNMNLRIKPGGSALAPDKSLTSQIPFLPMFCTYKYRFKYDVEYPVIVRVTDKDSAKLDAMTNMITEKGGFTFSFPMDVYVCGNQKRKCNFKNYSIDKSLFNNLLSDEINIDVSNVVNVDQTPFCDEPSRQSPELTLEVRDSVSNNPVKNAQVGYYGGNFNNDCVIGETDDKGVLKARMPFCSGCLIYFTAVNYSQKYEQFDVTTAMDTKKTFAIDPLKDYDVVIKIVYLPVFVRFWLTHSIYAQPYELAIQLGLTEEAVKGATGKSFNSLKKSDLMTIVPQLGATDPKKEMSIMISGSGPTDIAYMSNVNEAGFNKIKLGPGNYDLTFNVMGKVAIKPSMIDDGQGGKKELSMNPSGSGTYSGDWTLGTYSASYSLTREDMDGKSMIVFLVPVDYMPGDLIEVKDMGDSIMQPDGSLEYKSSPDDKNPLKIKQQDYAPYLSPVLR